MDDMNAGSRPSPESVRFPAVTFSQGVVHVIDSLESTRTKLRFKSGYYENLALVDSNSKRFQVIGAKKIRTVFKFSFDSFLGLLEFNPRWQVELLRAWQFQYFVG